MMKDDEERQSKRHRVGATGPAAASARSVSPATVNSPLSPPPGSPLTQDQANAWIELCAYIEHHIRFFSALTISKDIINFIPIPHDSAKGNIISSEIMKFWLEQRPEAKAIIEALDRDMKQVFIADEIIHDYRRALSRCFSGDTSLLYKFMHDHPGFVTVINYYRNALENIIGGFNQDFPPHASPQTQPPTWQQQFTATVATDLNKATSFQELVAIYRNYSKVILESLLTNANALTTIEEAVHLLRSQCYIKLQQMVASLSTEAVSQPEFSAHMQELSIIFSTVDNAEAMHAHLRPFYQQIPDNHEAWVALCDTVLSRLSQPNQEIYQHFMKISNDALLYNFMTTRINLDCSQAKTIEELKAAYDSMRMHINQSSAAHGRLQIYLDDTYKKYFSELMTDEISSLMGSSEDILELKDNLITCNEKIKKTSPTPEITKKLSLFLLSAYLENTSDILKQTQDMNDCVIAFRNSGLAFNRSAKMLEMFQSIAVNFIKKLPPAEDSESIAKHIDAYSKMLFLVNHPLTAKDGQWVNAIESAVLKLNEKKVALEQQSNYFRRP